MTNEWIDPSLKVVTAIATTTVALCVARISWRQWFTNKEKLRLDLYEKRFGVYMRVLDLFQALILWDGSAEQKALTVPFIKAHLESRFLFPESSGIHAYLSEFRDHAFRIMNFDQLKSLGASDRQLYMKYTNERLESATWILSSMEPLEKKLAPYLNFHEI
jgi:hypothetical protein